MPIAMTKKSKRPSRPKRQTNKCPTMVGEDSVPYHANGTALPKKLKFIDLFCGIGGFRFAMNAACKARGFEGQCVFSSDSDADAQTA